MQPSIQLLNKLRFDSALLRRYLLIAQPFFYPAEESGRSFGLLLIAVLVSVVSASYWLLLAAIAVALQIAPTLVPEDLENKELIGMPWPLLAAVGLGVAAVQGWRCRTRLTGKWERWGRLACIVFLLLCHTGLKICFSYAMRGINNELVAKHESGFYNALLSCGVVLACFVPVLSVNTFSRMKLCRKWREYLCQLYIDLYFARQSYYRLDSNSGVTCIDSPDQRITEDVDYFTSQSLSFLLDMLSGVLDLLAFAGMLWNCSRALMGSLVAYAIVGTTIAASVGQKMMVVNYEQLRLEADLRYSLVRIRENAEAIAFYKGERIESSTVRSRLAAALSNYDLYIRWSTVIMTFQKIFQYVAGLVPYFVMGGLYLKGDIEFGIVGQASLAFYEVLGAVTLIVDKIKDISRFAAGINRLGAFYDALVPDAMSRSTVKRKGDNSIGFGDIELGDPLVEAWHGEAAPDQQISFVDGPGLEIESLTLKTPTGRTLVEGLSLMLGSGNQPRRLLIVGPAGAGKSSLLRAIAGLWSTGLGRIRRPPLAEIMFLPQKPYMTLGDMRAQLLYPNLTTCKDEDLFGTLAAVSLQDLPMRFQEGLSTVEDWSRVLSGGEQQRLAVARCLLARPSPGLLVLDEATSALPVEEEANLYKLLKQRDMSYISVGHRNTLAEHHEMVLQISDKGNWRLIRAEHWFSGAL